MADIEIPTTTINGHFAPIVSGITDRNQFSPFLYVDLYKFNGLTTELVMENALTLLDTGADICYIDVKLAKDLQLPIVGQGFLNGAAGQSSGDMVELYFSILAEPELFRQKTIAMVAALRENNIPFDLMLGNIFLNEFKVTLNHSQNTVKLEKY